MTFPIQYMKQYNMFQTTNQVYIYITITMVYGTYNLLWFQSTKQQWFNRSFWWNKSPGHGSPHHAIIQGYPSEKKHISNISPVTSSLYLQKIDGLPMIVSPESGRFTHFLLVKPPFSWNDHLILLKTPWNQHSIPMNWPVQWPFWVKPPNGAITTIIAQVLRSRLLHRWHRSPWQRAPVRDSFFGAGGVSCEKCCRIAAGDPFLGLNPMFS